MPNRKQPTDSANLLLFEQPEPVTDASEASALTLVENSVLGTQTPSTATSLDAQRGKKLTMVGHTDAQRKRKRKFDSTKDKSYPSRVVNKRIHAKVDRVIVRAVKDELKTMGDNPPHFQDVIRDGLILWLQARAAAKLGTQVPTGSGLSSSSGLDQDIYNTTTTTLGTQTPKSVLLPGVASAIAELSNLPHDSRHTLEINLAYAYDQHRNDLGIRAPDVWATSNYRTGSKDALIDLWLERQRQIAEEQARKAAAEEERQRREQETQARWAAEEAERLLREQAEQQARAEAERLAADQRRADLERRAAEEAEWKRTNKEQGKQPWETARDE